METFSLKNITYSNGGKKIEYHYNMTSGIKKLFNPSSPFYTICDHDISKVPYAINIIPLLGNIAPIAWFAGFNIEVEEIDKGFYESLQAIKAVFDKNYPNFELKGRVSPKKIVDIKKQGDKTAMLFSGGVDAFATFIRIIDKKPDLVTIHGADIEIEDNKQWEDFLKFNKAEKATSSNPKEYIEANIRDFYTYKVDLQLPGLGWWGKIQHGLGLVSLLAPLSYVKGYSNIYIGSSHTDHIDVNWGSSPEIDEKVSWSGLKTFHDGYELIRPQKIDLITDFAERTNTDLKLRVCYSELNKGLNCSHCEKCYRTMLGIILSGKDPNNYGFKVDDRIYKNIFDKLEQGHLTDTGKFHWWELMEKAKTTDDYFIFTDENKERLAIERLKNGEIDRIFDKSLNQNKKSKVSRYKYILRNRFSSLYSMYQKIKN